MGLKLYEESDIQAIGDSIRRKNGSDEKYKVRDMSGAVDALKNGSTYPDNALIKLEDYDENGYPRTFVYNEPSVTTAPSYLGGASNSGMVSPLLRNVTKIVIPKTVTVLSDYSLTGIGSYKDNGAVTEIIGWENVTDIGRECFSNVICELNVPWPPNLKKIGYRAFRRIGDCPALPNSVETIGDKAFEYNFITQSFCLPSKLRNIGADAFYTNGARNLDISYIPPDVETIGSKAFKGSLKASIDTLTFKGTPTSIAADSFFDNQYVTSIRVPWEEGEVAGAPWGAVNATIIYNYTGEE